MVKTPSQRRKEMQEELKTRTEESYKSREDSGKFGGILKKELEVSEWRCDKGEHTIDIIPYIAGKGNPNVNVKPGSWSYAFDCWTHSGIGVGEDMYICLARTYKERCPICEHQKALRDQDAADDVVKALNPVRRTIYNIVCYDTPEAENKGVRVWIVAYYFMEKHIVKLSKHPRGGGHSAFASSDTGKQIMFDRTGVGGGNTAYDGHRLVDRDYTISDEILDSANCLEDIVHKPTYEEVSDAFWGKGEQEQVPISTNIEEEEDAPFDEEPPSLPSRVSRTRQLKKTQIEEDACPHKAKFGADIDKIDDCAECRMYEKCAVEADRLEEEERKKRAEKRQSRLKR